jgi:hypothetical protein
MLSLESLHGEATLKDFTEPSRAHGFLALAIIL